MKKAVRPFVVEIKSGRRRTNVTQRALWGTTDFKAMLNEVAAEAPHLFTPTDAQVIGDGAEERLVEVPTISVTTTDKLPAGTVARTARVVETPRSKARGAARRRDTDVAILGKKPARRNQRPVEAAPSRDHYFQERSDQTELFVLEEENRRLKLLLADFLRQQNSQLRTMLERFDHD